MEQGLLSCGIWPDTTCLKRSVSKDEPRPVLLELGVEELVIGRGAATVTPRKGTE